MVATGKRARGKVRPKPPKRSPQKPRKKRTHPRARKPPKRARSHARAREQFAKRSAAAKKGWAKRRAKSKIVKAMRDREWSPQGGWQGEDHDEEEEIAYMTADEVYEQFDKLADRLELPISDIYRMSHGYEPLH